MFPELVRDYAVEVREEGTWRSVVHVEANRRRQRVHPLEGVRADALRLTIFATNGAPQARVVSARVS